jgi:ubiquinone/menaquinone biosynthesis C-methylase UbiE
MKDVEGMRGKRWGARYALAQEKQCGSAILVPPTPASTASCSRRRDLPLPKPIKGAILVSKLPGTWRTSVKTWFPIAQQRSEKEVVDNFCAVRDLYDNLMYQPLQKEYYGQSDFYNYGFWDQTTSTQKEASANLMQHIIDLIPDKKGSILDVACGKGATTQYLIRYFSPSQVVGINISERQLQTAREKSCGCHYLVMDATELAFGNASFENVICVEAAFHFDTREQFLHESYRILKPGGYLVLSDIIFARIPGKQYRHTPDANLVKDVEVYTSVYRKAGYYDIRIIDASQQCWIEYRRNSLRWMFRNGVALYNAGRASIGDGGRALIGLFLLSAVVKRYLLVSARKA